jgi:hypothetical protein
VKQPVQLEACWYRKALQLRLDVKGAAGGSAAEKVNTRLFQHPATCTLSLLV